MITVRRDQGYPKTVAPMFSVSLVRAKTFSTHVVSEYRHVVSKTGVFTHVKIRPERFRGYVLMRVRPSILFPIASFLPCRTSLSATWSFRVAYSRLSFPVSFPDGHSRRQFPHVIFRSFIHDVYSRLSFQMNSPEGFYPIRSPCAQFLNKLAC